MNPRLRRLQNDYEKLKELAARSAFVEIEQTNGSPPDKYVVHLTCKGITSVRNGKPSYSHSHRLGILLPANYPRERPAFTMLTPVYHPNIAANGTVCYGDEGDHGFAPSMALDDLVVRIIQIIRYENIGLHSAFNWEAAQWAKGQQERKRSFFPLESTQIIGEEPLEIDILGEITKSGADDLGIVIL